MYPLYDFFSFTATYPFLSRVVAKVRLYLSLLPPKASYFIPPRDEFVNILLLMLVFDDHDLLCDT